MKFMFIWMMILALAPSAFAQESTVTEEQIQSRAGQILADLQNQRNVRELEQLTERRQAAATALTHYNKLIISRDDDITEKLKRAIADGDETLIEVALDDVRANKYNIQSEAKWLVDGESFSHGRLVIEAARQAYRDDIITEEQYTNHLKFFRMIKARIEEPTPAALSAMIDEARKKVPEYFALWEKIGRPF